MIFPSSIPKKLRQANQMENSTPQCILLYAFEISFQIHRGSNFYLFPPNAIENPPLLTFPPEDSNLEPSSFLNFDRDLKPFEISNRMCRKCNFQPLAYNSGVLDFLIIILQLSQLLENIFIL